MPFNNNNGIWNTIYNTNNSNNSNNSSWNWLSGWANRTWTWNSNNNINNNHYNNNNSNIYNNNNNSNNNDKWICSNCNKQNISDINKVACSQCNGMNSDKHKHKARILYLLGVIPSLRTDSIRTSIPFFIFPLDKPTVTYTMNEMSDGLSIKFYAHLTDTKETTKYKINKIRIKFKINPFMINKKYHNKSIIISSQKHEPDIFTTFLYPPYHGKYSVDVWCLVRYKIGNKQYDHTSPKTTINMTIKRPKYYHEQVFDKFIIKQDAYQQIQRQSNNNNNNNNTKSYNSVQLIELSLTSCEYNSVLAQFMSTYTHKSDVIVYKISNKLLLDAYLDKKKRILQLLNNNKSKLNELLLWHGTALEKLPKILHQGFLRQFSGSSSGCVYGKGTYFARDSRLSVSYSPSDNNSFQHLLLCRVICGEYCIGNSNMIIPPTKPNSKYIPYETTVNCMTNPSIYVTFMDDQALPAYLISFRSTS